MFIPLNKGKDITNLPKSKVPKPDDLVYISTKFDGARVQIHKNHNTVRFFTSGGKEFYIEHIARELLLANSPKTNFILECEYIADTAGKHGDRGKAAKLTTYRTSFSKNIPSLTKRGRDIFKVFDIISPKPFGERLNTMKYDIKFTDHIQLVDHALIEYSKVDYYLEETLKQGYEGVMVKLPTHLNIAGKRVNDCIKFKAKPTVDLEVIEATLGEGKYSNMLGSLVCIDEDGVIVKVGSGLNDAQRVLPLDYWIGRVIECKYESFNKTYIQPIFLHIRHDKGR